MTNEVALESSPMLMVTHTKASGENTSDMATVPTHTPILGHDMSAHGRTVCAVVMVN